jgi:integrase
MATWRSTKYPGIRYREHPTRKHGVQMDRYYTVRYSLNGKQQTEALGWASAGWTEQKANRELARIKEAQRVGGEIQTLAEAREVENQRREAEKQKQAQALKDAVTFSQFFEDIYSPNTEKSGKRKKTIETEKSYYKKWIKPVIGGKALKEIATFDLKRIKQKLQNADRSPQTITHVFAIVRRVLNEAMKNGSFEGENPVKDFKLPKADARRIRFLSHREAEDLLNALAKKSIDIHDIALLALDCAPRAGEIYGLDWQDIDLERGMITFRSTKNGVVRHIPMTDRVKEMLEDRAQNARGSIVFPARGGGRKVEVSNAFARAVEGLGLNAGITDRRQKVVFHTLRHTCASWLVMAGVPLYTVKEYLGHKQISQTERYSHLAPDSLLQATNVLNGISKTENGKVINLR